VRILHTANTYAPSLDGVAEVVRNVSERLAQRGHEVHVATSALPKESSYVQLGGVHVHRFSATGNLASGMRGEIANYREFVKSGSWHILVNHCAQVWPTDALLEQVAGYVWPSVLVTHGLLVDNVLFAKYYSDLPRYITDYSKWIRISSLSEEARFAESCHLPTPQVITNGVDLLEWTLPSLGLRNNWGINRRPWIVNVSNHNPLKNHRAFFRLANCLCDVDAHLTLVGGTYPANRWGLGRFGVSGGCAYDCAIRAKLSKGRVVLRTNLRRAEVVSAIKEADLIVSCSKWEANSVILLESMAAGTPWVSFDVGSARDNVGGVTVQNLDEMAKVVKELLRDPGRRVRMGTEGRARTAEKHDWNKLTREYEQVYETAVRDGVHACLY
jgi:L-malate glycosyltransferase